MAKYGVTDSDLQLMLYNTNIPIHIMKAIMEVESLGTGFDKKTGKILIQFEPHLFKRAFPKWMYFKNGVWSNNGVDVQSKEWLAFNEAFSVNAEKAMESTSIGLPQILGSHWKRLGFSDVHEMWNSFKESELNQVKSLIKFILTDQRLIKAIKTEDWNLFASVYNGSGYKKLAQKLGTVPYDEKIRIAVQKHKKR